MATVNEIAIQDGVLWGIGSFLGLVLSKRYTAEQAIPWALGIGATGFVVKKYVWPPKEIETPDLFSRAIGTGNIQYDI